MKTKLILMGWLMAGGLNLAHADLTVVQKIDYVSGVPEKALPMMPSQVTTRIKGTKLRTETPPVGYSIMDLAGGDMTTVIEAQKAYVKMPRAAVAGKTNEMLADLASAAPVATGEKERVGDYDTEIYTLTLPQVKMKFWVAKDYPDYARLKEEMNKMPASAFMGGMLANVKLPVGSELPGLTVRMEIETSQPRPMTMRTTVVSISQEPVSDDIFVIPADYKLLGMPANEKK